MAKPDHRRRNRAPNAGFFIKQGASFFDFAEVMFPDKNVILKAHLRCVELVIGFSMLFYNVPPVPLRAPKAAERLVAPLLEVYLEDGERRGKT
jgi:hypothetical protein